MRTIAQALLIVLLAAAQLAAPLLHAHVGGEVLLGQVHLPGMEALSAPADQATAQALDFAAQEPGLVVGVATGMQWKAAPVLLSAPALAAALPADRPAGAAPSPRGPPPIFIPDFSPSPPGLTQAAPRAPPRLFPV
jgi:hypothetical protein